MKSYCPRCGTEFKNNDKFCSQCGHQNPNIDTSVVRDISMEKIIAESQSEELKNVTLKQDKGNKIISEESKAQSAFIIGIISLVFSLAFNMISLIMSTFGLIKAIKVKKETPHRRAAIAMNTIALVISGFVLTFGVSIFPRFYRDSSKIDISTTQSKNEIPIAGRFNCQGGSSSYDTGEYNMVLYLDNYNHFTIGTYGDLENNKATGTYTYKYLNKTDHSGNYKYYEVKLNGYKNSFIHNGEVQEDAYNTVLEFAITKKNGKKEGLIYFTPSSSMNYCFTK